MCSRKEGRPVIYQLSDRRSIDPPPDIVVRSAKAMQFISFMSSLEGCVGIWLYTVEMAIAETLRKLHIFFILHKQLLYFLLSGP